MVNRSFYSPPRNLYDLSESTDFITHTNAIAYSASKAGVIGLTKSFAEALAKDNVRVNAVAPGLIDTEIIDGVDPLVLEGIVSAMPMSWIDQLVEIAELVRFLLSDRSSFTTGQTAAAA